MKQQDWDHRKTSCQAFIRGVIDVSTKIWDEVIRSYINGFNIVVIGDSFSGLHPSAGILAEYTGQVRIWSSGHDDF